MILKGQPGRVVQKRKRVANKRHKIVPWFKFDENGLAQIDESKVSPTDLSKLKKLFEVVENVKESKNDGKVNLSELKHKELVELAKEKGIKYFGLKKKELIEKLGGEKNV